MIKNQRWYFKKCGGGYFLSGIDFYSKAAEYVKKSILEKNSYGQIFKRLYFSRDIFHLYNSLAENLPLTASFFSWHVISKENYVTKKSVLILCPVLYPAYIQGNFSCYLNIGYCYGETGVGI